MTDLNIVKKRLLYQSQHRGMKELDNLFGTFVQNNLDSLSASDLQSLEKLLEKSDVELYTLFCEFIQKDPLRGDGNPERLIKDWISAFTGRTQRK